MFPFPGQMEMAVTKEIVSYNSRHHGRNAHTGDNNNEEDKRAVVEEIGRLEKRLFPKHESLASSFLQELAKPNCGLLYALSPVANANAQKTIVAGYLMYSWPSCLLASINKLAVRQDCRREGYGEALLRAGIEKCKTRNNIQRISLHVDPLRTAALSLYQKLGFRIDALIDSYYAPGRHAYRMFLDFH